MKKLPGLFMAVMAFPSLASAQLDPTRVFTRPTEPSVQALERMNMTLAWRAHMPVDGRRDGLFSVHPLGSQILVQMRSGSVAAVNAETGATEWRTRAGSAYQVAQPLAFNAQSVFLIRGQTAYALDRRTGRLQWEIDLPTAVTAAPVADDERLYLCLLNKDLQVYELPGKGQRPDLDPAKRYGGPHVDSDEHKFATGYSGSATFRGRGVSSVSPYTDARTYNPRPAGDFEPRLGWQVRTLARIEQQPLLSQKLVTLVGTDSSFYPTSRTAPEEAPPYQIEDRLAAPIGQHGDIAYVASQDSALQALDLTTGQARCRTFVGGAKITRKPEVTDADVYLATDLRGLVRVDRATGRALWANANADRFLSVNLKYVFAADRRGRLLILDRDRGTQVGTLDTSEFVVPISNEMTDRVLLGSNDGLILCLHDRGYRTPLLTKKVVEKKPDAKIEGKPPVDKGEGKEPDKEMKKKDPEKKQLDKDEKKA